MAERAAHQPREPGAHARVGEVDDAGHTAPATVVATVTELAGNAEPRDVTAFARGMAEGLVRSKKGATLRRGPEARVVSVGGVRAARITFDVDHLSDQGLDHVVSYAAWSDEGDYNLTFMTAPAHAAAVDALADRVATTLRIARPASPPPVWSAAGDAGGYVAGAVLGALLVPALLWVFRVRARRNRAAPAAAK